MAKAEWAKNAQPHKKKDQTVLMEMHNGQFLTTMPREIVRWKKLAKGAVLKWSDGGPNRITIELTV